MASEFGSYLSSELVQVLAQDGSASFNVHKEILLAQSTLFKFSVPGVLTEWLIELPDWDGVTVACVLEFLYRGRYAYPHPVFHSPNSLPVVTLSVWGDDCTSSSPGGEPVGTADEHVETAAERLARFDPALCDYRGVLLAHARVYHLAQLVTIERLVRLALKHLSDTLSCLTEPVLASSPVLSDNILDLARYVYGNLSLPGAHRTLVSQFIVRNFAVLNTNPGLSSLFAEDGRIVKDVMMGLHTRLPVSAGVVISAPSRYVARLLVKTKVHESLKPDDHLQDLNGGDARLNYPKTFDSATWLVPRYTSVAEDACTGISLIIARSASQIPGAELFATNRHLFNVVDRAVKRKITEVTLLRCSKRLKNVSAVPCEYGDWHGMSTDLNAGQNEGCLYVVWRSVTVE